ncbi:alpha/beta hydrolase family protein [Winogradskyella ursingii]|uniref:alpha/beta hydrolase family protein n=1 Tax=Winogradskyella ursingii TaxID=2686079 RepID=UPI0015CCF4C2|nr:alpha/beta fold hydrolase [Winogradskyella ursingii]
MTEPIEVSIKTVMGHNLGATVFKPKNQNNKSIIISSATGVLQRFYHKFARYFSELGYTIYTFDYYGIGKSNSNVTSLKQNKINLKSWGENDQAAVVAYVKSQNVDHKIIVITHSIGGQILAFNQNIHQIDAIITVASQSGYWKHWKGYERYRMFTFWYLMIPMLTPIFGYFPAKTINLFENLPKQMVYQWRRWGRQKDYMLSEYNYDDLQFKNFHKDLLSLSFPNDEYASVSSVDWLTKQFINSNVDRRHVVPGDLGIPNIGHFGFFRDKFQDSLWTLLHKWIEEHS